MTRRYQIVVPSGVRIARSIASRNSSAPPERNASRPIDSALTVSSGSLLPIAFSRPPSSTTFMSSSSYESLRSMVTQIPLRSLPTTRAISASDTRVSPFHTRQSPVSSSRAMNSDPVLSATL